MNRKQLDLLLKLIDAKVAEYKARYSSDGGLIESIRISEIERELGETIEDED